MTMSEVAVMLNVSHTYVIKLIETGELSCLRVGDHRRFRRENVLQYQRTMQASQLLAMRELAELSAELGLEY